MQLYLCIYVGRQFATTGTYRESWQLNVFTKSRGTRMRKAMAAMLVSLTKEVFVQ